MAAKISLTPSELMAQGNEMAALRQEYDIVTTSTAETLHKVNQNWSENLARNFEGKLTNALKAFGNVSSMLSTGAELAVKSATTFESIDTLLANATYQEDGGNTGGGASDGTGTSAPQAAPASSPDAVLNELNDRYARLIDQSKSKTFKSKCSAFVFQQLKDMGIVTGNKAGESAAAGKDLAPGLAKMGTTSTGYTCTAYNSFDDIVNMSQQGPVTNVVLSFAKGGNFSNPTYGHTMLISRIENGQVYFVDNCSWNCPGNPGRNTGQYEAKCMSLDQFKSLYFRSGTNVTGITHLYK